MRKNQREAKTNKNSQVNASVNPRYKKDGTNWGRKGNPTIKKGYRKEEFFSLVLNTIRGQEKIQTRLPKKKSIGINQHVKKEERISRNRPISDLSKKTVKCRTLFGGGKMVVPGKKKRWAPKGSVQIPYRYQGTIVGVAI